MPASSIVRGTTSGNSGSTTASTTSVTVTAPTGVASGDRLVVWITLRTDVSAAWRAPAGWTLQSTPTSLSTGNDYLYTATYGTDVTGTSWTWDAGASNTTANRWAWGCLALIGSSVGVLAASATGVDSSSGTSHTAGPITTTAADYLVGVFGDRASGTSWTWPAGWVEQIDTQGTGTNATSVTVAVYDTTPTAAGTYSVTVTPSATDTAWWGLLAYAQAGSGGGTAASASGAITLGGTATSGSGTRAASASGAITLSGTAAGSGPGETASPYPGATIYPGATTYPGTGTGSTGGGGSASPSSGPSTNIYRSGGFALWYTVDALRDGVLVAGATDLQPIGGQVTDTMKPGVRRTLSLDLPKLPGLYDLLAPTGTTLRVTAHVRDIGRQQTDIPMGVFTVDDQSADEGAGKISITAPDLWQKIKRAKFIGPYQSIPGLSVAQQIAALIQDALGSATTVTITASSRAVMGEQVFEKDRDTAILTLAESIGAWVYADRSGNWVIADLPRASAEAAWLLDANPAGVLTELTRSRSRTSTYNVVAVEPQSASAPTFQTVWVWDTDPNSSTYAGPVGDGTSKPDPAQAGPFGLSVYYASTSLPLDPAQAQVMAYTILAKTVGLGAQVSLSTHLNPAIDAGDVFEVLPPRERYDMPRVSERHVAETVTHPLALDASSATHIDGRSTRTDAYS